MAASERLYELWLLYYAQVSPPHAAPAVPAAPRAPRLLHLRPASLGPRRCARARGEDLASGHTCAPPPARRCLPHLNLGDDPRGRAPH